MHDEEITIEKKPNIFVRIAIIVGMLLILFFIAATIVRYIPKIISAISPANVSLTSLFNPSASSSTPSTNAQNYSPAPANQTNVGATSTIEVKTIPTTQKSQTTNNTYTYKTYSGPANLSITLSKVGYLGSNGAFVQSTSIPAGSRVLVEFNVANIGSGRSGNWNLQASLPTSIAAERSYISQAEPALNPGDSYQMSLAFDSYDASQNTIQIAIVGGDSNSGNNTLSIPLTSNGTSYNNNTPTNGCYWSNGSYYCNNSNYNNGTTGYTVCYGANNIPYYCNNSSNGNNNGNYNNSTSDLSINITNIGTMDRNTGQFYFTNSWSRNDKIAVQFAITNIGGTTSGNWAFSANLPSSSNSTYSSNTQNALAPGQSATYTLGFDNPNSGSQNLSLQLILQGNVSDSNSDNNYTSRSIYIN